MKLVTEILTDRLNDREKFGLAFAELQNRGYYAPISFAWDICCNSCGLAAIEQAHEEGKVEDLRKYVFWHFQKDDGAFIGDGSWPPEAVCEALSEAEIDPDDDEALEAWFEDVEHAAFTHAAELDERLHKYNNLVDVLYLHWDGNAEEIVEVLRKNGLDAELPDQPQGRCIPVNPSFNLSLEGG